MSFYEVTFKYPKTKSIKKIEKTVLENIEKTVLENIENEQPINTGFEHKNGKAKLYGDISDDFECSFWLPIFDAIIKEGGKDPLIKIFFDSTGEDGYFIKIGEEIRGFENLEDLNEALSSKNELNLKFSGKDGNDNTLLIRLRVKAKKKRQKLKEIFELQSEDDFVENFNSYNTKRIKWPSFYGYTDDWYHGPENLFKGKSFVIEEDQYIYIGFNLEGVDNLNAGSIEDLLGTILFTEVTDKIWAKHRKTNNKEQIFMEVGGEIYERGVREKSDDNDWDFN